LTYAGQTVDKKPALKAKLSLEKRTDRGDTATSNINQKMAVFDIKGKYNQDITLFSKIDWAESVNNTTGLTNANDNRFDVGFAYRPIMSDDLNIIAKYTNFKNHSPDQQEGATGVEQTKGEVFSMDMLYDISDSIALGARFAYRMAQEKVENYGWQNSEMQMNAARFNFKLNKNNGVNLEFRYLKDKNLGDVKKGYLVEYVHFFGDEIRAAIGYNQSGYSADLVDLNYKVSDVYIRASKAF
jgi:hypothetical protein